MKKENKKMAQQKRAEERRREEARKKRNNILKIVVPIAVIVILIAAIVIGTIQPYNRTSSENTETEAAATALSTDTALTIEDGDTVNIDYVGSIDGVEFDGGSTQGNGADLVIGSGTYIDNFEEQLIGTHPGDTVDVIVTFPEDYGAEELSGQEALFVVTVNGIYV